MLPAVCPLPGLESGFGFWATTKCKLPREPVPKAACCSIRWRKEPVSNAECTRSNLTSVLTIVSTAPRCQIHPSSKWRCSGLGSTECPNTFICRSNSLLGAFRCFAVAHRLLYRCEAGFQEGPGIHQGSAPRKQSRSRHLPHAYNRMKGSSPRRGPHRSRRAGPGCPDRPWWRTTRQGCRPCRSGTCGNSRSEPRSRAPSPICRTHARCRP